MEKSKLRLMILSALIAGICVIGSFIKIPGFITTAALDSAPAFISVAFLPPLYSGFAGAIGHLATALTSGFPSGPFHIIIAVEMFIVVYIFNVPVIKKGFKITKWVFLIIANNGGAHQKLRPVPVEHGAIRRERGDAGEIERCIEGDVRSYTGTLKQRAVASRC